MMKGKRKEGEKGEKGGKSEERRKKRREKSISGGRIMTNSAT